MLKALASLLMVISALTASAINVSNRYRSPRNPERKVRKSTELIVLHTTEAPEKSSLTKLCDRGEAHYCVTESGQIYAIVDRDREAFHAGRSMWNGKEDCDKFSIGIECVGYHNKPMNIVQIRAIRDLVKDLQRMYRLADHQVVCHSHVAYGSPNRWHRFKHRGRKRCGMLFAMPSVRRLLDLKSKPAGDADVRAGRLRNADDYLKSVLYGRVDTMKSAYSGTGAAAPKPETAPSGGGLISRWASKLGLASGHEPESAKPEIKAKPEAQPRAEIKAKPAAAQKAETKSEAKPKTPPAGKRPQSIAQLRAWGWVEKGTVSKENSASRIAGGKWKSPDTYYTIRNHVIPGDRIDESRIEKGMTVWLKK